MQILNDSEARFNSADLNIAYKMNVDEYQKLCPYSGELEANWGKAPGKAPAFLPSLHPFRFCLSCPASPALASVGLAFPALAFLGLALPVHDCLGLACALVASSFSVKSVRADSWRVLQAS